MRKEYPRPQFVRDPWLNLNGEWEFAFDDGKIGLRDKWYRQYDFPLKIQVPFCYQSKLSGIGDPGFHDVVWYRRTFSLPESFLGKRVLLHFGAVDYAAKVWLNGQLVKEHEGGHTPFSVDITDELQAENILVVRAEDFSRDVTLPRGKQYWKEQSEGIFYTRTTGIWQTVWLEAVAETHLEKVKFTPDIDTGQIGIKCILKGFEQGTHTNLKICISFKGEPVAEDIIQVRHPVEERKITLSDWKTFEHHRMWTPSSPHLYDAELTLVRDGEVVDRVKSYFGMRKISIHNGKLCLNNTPFFLKMVLDQGYFPDGLLTAPTDEDLKRDVELTKAMGFNGARKHQKVEDPRYLYWCDTLGLLVWGEMANAYQYSEEYVTRMTGEWLEVIERDYNHPCIMAWVPINESWGVPQIKLNDCQQHHSLSLYHLTKSLDPTRLVISNDGWEHTRSDLLTIHDYEWRREVLDERYRSEENTLSAMPANRPLYAFGYLHEGQPIIVSEFGGISFKTGDREGWGYSEAKDEDDFVNRVKNVIQPLLDSPVVQGYCYTQLTDVEQEINGLLTYDRQPKVPPELIRQINEGNKSKE
ncbi:glycoside hydrolase family 2 protein [Lihuaxuella thermophila]|uniref:Glycosyl hydrolases family 2 n=1 Tax=Lihuaxuella thermophila TaxID=1173111 RepID=A0A1H8AJE4_9BACL|nr:sugar-binding domain-containing protein [Lihuaxuella thermophila]SEM70731.1 Glycosyl hydrolases family 2 [Lihuaxuella thermophila]